MTKQHRLRTDLVRTEFSFLLALCFLLLGCGKAASDQGAAEFIGGRKERVTRPDSQVERRGWSIAKPLPGGFGNKSGGYRPAGLARKEFAKGGKVFSPMDMISQDLTMKFDASAKTFRGHSRIHFSSTADARPLFLLSGTVTAATLDGEPVETFRTKDPEGLNSFVAVDEELPASSESIVELDYILPEDRYSFENGGASLLTDMTDLDEQFFEMWGPANFEEDAFELNLHVQVRNATLSREKVFSNGKIELLGPGDWMIRFPSHFTSSSMYFHLTTRDLETRSFTYRGLEREIPVTVYAADATLADGAVKEIPKLFRELEGDYGPYAHPAFLAYINPDGGGMEYSGATISSLWALDHELFHSWFARGVMPAEGRSGWIDEAMASWRDYEYFRSKSLLERAPTNLASYSPYWRATPGNCYDDGRAFLSELDLLFAARGGMKPLLRAWFSKYSPGLVTTEEFWAFLERETGADLTPYFSRYILDGHEPFVPVLGTRRNAGRSISPSRAPLLDKHPRPLSREEVTRLR